MACFASSTVNCDTIKTGDVIEEGTVIVDVYSWSDYEGNGSAPRTKIQSYDTWTAVLELYSDLFNRTPSEEELDNWIDAVENGATR